MWQKQVSTAIRSIKSMVQSIKYKKYLKSGIVNVVCCFAKESDVAISLEWVFLNKWHFEIVFINIGWIHLFSKSFPTEDVKDPLEAIA